MREATVAIIHDTRRAKKGDKYPIKLRVIYERRVKYYATKENLTAVEYAVKPGKVDPSRPFQIDPLKTDRKISFTGSS